MKKTPSWLVILLSLSLVGSFSGCDMIKKFIPGQNAENAEVEGNEEEGAEGETPPANEEQALFGTENRAPISSYRPVHLKLSDGLIIEGTLYVPGMSPYVAPKQVAAGEDEESSGEEDAPAEEAGEGEEKSDTPVAASANGYPLIVLNHMLSDDRWIWKDFPADLVKAGYAVLAYDMRGHGESIYRNKQLYVWRQFDDSDWKRMPKDINQMLAAISKDKEFKNVNTHRVAIIGASIGANVALNYAMTPSSNTNALVLLSPGLEYHGIQTLAPVAAWKKPIFLLASKEDVYAADSTQKLYNAAKGKKKIQIFQDLGTGTDMLGTQPSLKQDIIRWLSQVFPGKNGTVPATSTEKTSGEDETADNTDTKVDVIRKDSTSNKPIKPRKARPKVSVPTDKTLAAKKTSKVKVPDQPNPPLYQPPVSKPIKPIVNPIAPPLTNINPKRTPSNSPQPEPQNPVRRPGTVRTQTPSSSGPPPTPAPPPPPAPLSPLRPER